MVTPASMYRHQGPGLQWLATPRHHRTNRTSRDLVLTSWRYTPEDFDNFIAAIL